MTTPRNTQLQTVPRTALPPATTTQAPIQALQTGSRWNMEDKALIKSKCAKNATDEEFKLLLNIAGKYGLDPLVGQIWCQKYWNSAKKEYYPAQIFVGLHGLLEIANRENRLDGISDEVLYNAEGDLIGARATVWKRGASHPFITEVDFEEYKSPNNKLWGEKPKTMIKKVAKAQALRLAFNLSGLYIPEEFDAGLDQMEISPAPVRNYDEGNVVEGEVINAKTEERKTPASTQFAKPAPASTQNQKNQPAPATQQNSGSHVSGPTNTGNGKKKLSHNEVYPNDFTPEEFFNWVEQIGFTPDDIAKAYHKKTVNETMKECCEPGEKEPLRAILCGFVYDALPRLNPESPWRWHDEGGYPVKRVGLSTPSDFEAYQDEQQPELPLDQEPPL